MRKRPATKWERTWDCGDCEQNPVEVVWYPANVDKDSIQYFENWLCSICSSFHDTVEEMDLATSQDGEGVS